MQVGDSVSLNKNSYHYLSKVLRVKKDQQVILFNGSGNNYYGNVNSFTNKSFNILIEKKIFIEDKSSNLEVAFSICKNPCSDLIIQKLTELGVKSVQPLISTNSIFSKRKIDYDKKKLHWKNISISASEQSERSYLPNIKSIISFQDYLENCLFDQKIILDTRTEKMLTSIHTKHNKSCTLLVGPEGDFTNEEYEYAKKLDFSSVSLGDNILRVETAAISAFSYLNLMRNSKNNA